MSTYARVISFISSKLAWAVHIVHILCIYVELCMKIKQFKSPVTTTSRHHHYIQMDQRVNRFSEEKKSMQLCPKRTNNTC